MYSLIVTPLGIDLATDMLIGEIRRLLPQTRTSVRWTEVNRWISTFAYQQQSDNNSGYPLVEACQEQAADFLAQLPIASLNSPLSAGWLSCQTVRALLLASGGYELDSIERDWHGAYYRPLLAYLQRYDRAVTRGVRKQSGKPVPLPMPFLVWSEN
ncbi:hypothetical protein [Spirosoma rhododendri]|uniref:Uncharacterized protein n=1 Tax=Spirosoma rhododendri TaxID=2728024 RepID=A0A7L5DQ40_9BACT|nr:hypothetical protein [Spirosoma rhododendri]QJD77820.1 hypothetical protein HH216_04800 [Spirosoma rhododendri]